MEAERTEDLTEWDDQADLLADDPFGSDLTEELAARAPRRWATRTTVVLAGLLLLVVGFAAGAQVQKRYGQQPAAAATTRTPVRQGGPAAAASAGAGRGDTPVTGTVKFVDGTTVYVTTADGDVVTVRTDGSTQVQLVAPGTVKDLAVGARVTVTGRSSGDATVTATRIVKDR